MHHDGSAGCSRNGFVMSASRGTKGEVKWSQCSRNVVQSLNMDCLRDDNGAPPEWDDDSYNNMPGRLQGVLFLIRFSSQTLVK